MGNKSKWYTEPGKLERTDKRHVDVCPEIKQTCPIKINSYFDHSKLNQNTKTEDLINISKNCIVTFSAKDTANGYLRILIDTGAESSIIKNTVILNLKDINKQEIRQFAGAFGGHTKTLGQFTTKLNDNHICTFNVVDNLNNQHIDAILGLDVLSSKAIIDLKNNNLILTCDQITQNFSNLNVVSKDPKIKQTSRKKKSKKQKASCNNRDVNVPSIPPILVENIAEKINENNKQKQINKKAKIKQSKQNTTHNLIKEINKIMQIDVSNNYRVKKNKKINTNKKQSNKIIIPAQSSKIIELTSPLQGTFICNRQEIQAGVFMANSISIVDNHNKQIKTVVINTGPNPQQINVGRFRRQFERINENYILEEPKNSNYINNLTETKSQSNKGLSEREQKIFETINASELTGNKRIFMEDIIHTYSDIFYLEGDKLGFTDIIEHRIDLEPGKGPVHAHPYKIPHSYKAEVKRQIQEMLDQKIIRPSISPYNAPIVVVKKKGLDKNGNPKLRICLDFRRLNDVTISDAYPLPNINEFLLELRGANYISIVDLAKGFHQVKVKEKDAHKTAFSFDYGHYEFIRMPFGLKNSPATFQRGLDRALINTQGVNAFCYIDDAIIISNDLETHRTKLEGVFNRFRKHNLKLQTEKCQFLKREVTYVGHRISKNGIAPDPARYESVKKFATPTTTKHIKQFLGLCNQYRKYIENYAGISGPLNDLLKGDDGNGRTGKQITWNNEAEHSFGELKEKLSNAPILKFPDFDKSFKLETDASLTAIGGILSNEGSDGAIQFVSRALKPAEKNYSTTERELLAIIYGLQQTRHIILGYKVKIVTDHKALTYMMNIKETNSRLIRWKLTLAEFDHEIVFRPGKEHTGADALSRLQLTEQNSDNSNIGVITRSGKIIGPTLISKPVIEIENTANEIQETSETNLEDIDIDSLLNSDVTVLTDPVEIEAVIRASHDSPLGGHQGITRTYKRIQRQFRWDNMMKDIDEYIRKCGKCQKNKTTKYTRQNLCITDTAQRPFAKCYLDIVGPVMMSNSGNKYILTFEDNLTKFMDCYPMPNQEANTVARIFYDEIISRYRIPEILLTDQGANFTSDVFKRVCKLLKINKIQTTAYRPQSNGALERSHRSLVEYLKNFVSNKPQDWDTWLRQAVHVHNNYPHTSTKLTPMDCLFGFTAELPTSIKSKVDPTYNFEDYYYELRHKLQTMYKYARENIIKSKERSKKQYDKHSNHKLFNTGQKVLLLNQRKQNKFSENWTGPFVVVSQDGEWNTTIMIGKKKKKVHNDKLKLFIE